jgi:hypothetical protein
VPFTFDGWIKQLFGGSTGGQSGSAAPGINTDSIDEAQAKVHKLKKSLLDLGGMSISPSIKPHIGGIGHASLEAPMRGSHSDYP